MNRLGEYLLEWKIKFLLELTSGFGGAGGIFTVIFFTGEPTTEPTLAYKAYETILLAGLGGVVGAIGGLLVAILWFFIKKWLKKRYNIEMNHKIEL